MQANWPSCVASWPSHPAQAGDFRGCPGPFEKVEFPAFRPRARGCRARLTALRRASPAAAEKKKVEEDKILAEKRKIDDKKERELAAEKAAEELIKQEESEKGKGKKK